MFNKLIKKIKSMAKNRNVLEKETEAPEVSIEQTKSSEVSDELTEEVLNKAISIAKNDDKVWDEITQEERWEYIKQARN